MKRINIGKIIDYLIIGSLFAMTILFILLPFIFVFKESFFVDGRLSLENFTYLLTKRRILIKNTLVLGVVSTILSSAASLIVSIYLYLSPKRRRSILLAILFITLISPPFVTSLSYINLFGRRGFITYGLLGLSLNVYGMWGIAVMQTISHLSLNVLLIYGFLKTLSPDIINSARNLGAKTDNIIVDIIFPKAKAGLKAVILLSFFRAIADFGTPAIIGGKFNVLALESYFAVIAEGNLSKASAMNILILIPSILIFIFYQNNLSAMAETSGFDRVELEIKRNGIIYYIFSVISLLLISALTVLYVTIIFSAFTRMKDGSLTFTLQNLIDTKPYITGAMIRSIVYSLISAVGGSIIGLLIGYYLQIRKLKAMKAVDFIANLPYIIPGTFFGLGYLLFFKNPPIAITGTAAVVVLNVVFKQLPFSARVGSSQMESIDRETLDSVKSLGGNNMNALYDVVLPLSKEGLKVSFINGFTTTMTTIGSIIFLVYPGRKVLTLVMFDVIQSGKYNIGSVIALIIILICLAINALGYMFFGGKNVS